MGFPLLVRWHIYIESAPSSSHVLFINLCCWPNCVLLVLTKLQPSTFITVCYWLHCVLLLNCSSVCVFIGVSLRYSIPIYCKPGSFSLNGIINGIMERSYEMGKNLWFSITCCSKMSDFFWNKVILSFAFSTRVWKLGMVTLHTCQVTLDISGSPWGSQK